MKITNILGPRFLTPSFLGQLSQLESALPGVDGVDLVTEDLIPLLTAWVKDEVVSFGKAVQIALALRRLFDCPVHFHELRSHGISFFVFSGSYSQTQFDEYGTPVELWLRAVTLDQVPAL